MTPQELTERLGWSHCPKRYLGCRFDNFNGYSSELADRLEIVRRAADKGKSAILFGPVGCGKTHLAVAMMASWVARGLYGRFIGAAEFAYRVQAAYGNAVTVVSELLDEEHDHFVLLDDLGAEKSTENARAALLYLVDHVYRSKLRIIVTSNMTPAQLSQYEPRLASRLAEIGLLVSIKGRDYRVTTSVRTKAALSR